MADSHSTGSSVSGEGGHSKFCDDDDDDDDKLYFSVKSSSCEGSHRSRTKTEYLNVFLCTGSLVEHKLV